MKRLASTYLCLLRMLSEEDSDQPIATITTDGLACHSVCSHRLLLKMFQQNPIISLANILSHLPSSFPGQKLCPVLKTKHEQHPNSFIPSSSCHHNKLIIKPCSLTSSGFFRIRLPSLRSLPLTSSHFSMSY